MSQAVLHELLTTGQRYAPEYRGGLSNHLPMALVALHALGADDARLREFFDRYTPRLSLAPPPGRVRDDWPALLGRSEAFPDLLASFAARQRAIGNASLLHELLPRLLPGVGAAAFHGLIRTAYGVAAAHDGEIAAGLAYWASAFLPLDAGAAHAEQSDIAAWIGALAGALADRRIEGGLIFERMREVGRTQAFALHAGRLAIAADTLGRLADFAAQRYVATRNFTVLHLVTSCHALRLLLPHVDDHDAALRCYANAFAAGCIASGIELNSAALRQPPLAWPEVVQRARLSNDDHVIKLVHSCREEAGVYGDGARLHAAALAVGA